MHTNSWSRASTRTIVSSVAIASVKQEPSYVQTKYYATCIRTCSKITLKFLVGHSHSLYTISCHKNLIQIFTNICLTAYEIRNIKIFLTEKLKCSQVTEKLMVIP